MKLTKEERRLAAKAARNYPKGFGSVFFACEGAPDNQTEAMALLVEKPEMLALG